MVTKQRKRVKDSSQEVLQKNFANKMKSFEEDYSDTYERVCRFLRSISSDEITNVCEAYGINLRDNKQRELCASMLVRQGTTIVIAVAPMHLLDFRNKLASLRDGDRELLAKVEKFAHALRDEDNDNLRKVFPDNIPWPKIREYIG